MLTHTDLDNLGEAVSTETYVRSGFSPTTGELRAETQTDYDDLGQAYQSRVYKVNPSTGEVGDYLHRRLV